MRFCCRLWLLLILSLCVNCCLMPVSALGVTRYVPDYQAPQIGAKGAALMDVSSGRLLSGKNEHMRLPMASTTKIMTAILAIESGRLADLVTVSNTAVRVEPSSIWLVPDERISLLHLVYGLMLRSGNDAACAIAEHLAGSVPAFAELMNQKAMELGMHNTNFKNPHGLPDSDHYTTAHDLAKLGAYALRNRQFTAIVSTTRISIPWEQHATPRIWHNKNRLLQTYPGADGVKTGWTRAAGYCLVASATRAGQRLVAVVLNSPDDWGEAARLLDYGFLNFQPVTVVSSGQYIRIVPIDEGYPKYVGAIAAEGYGWPLGIGEELELKYLIQLEPEITAPIRAGDQLGCLAIIHKGITVARLPLVTDQTSHRGWWGYRLGVLVDNFRQMLLR